MCYTRIPDSCDPCQRCRQQSYAESLVRGSREWAIRWAIFSATDRTSSQDQAPTNPEALTTNRTRADAALSVRLTPSPSAPVVSRSYAPVEGLPGTARPSARCSLVTVYPLERGLRKKAGFSLKTAAASVSLAMGITCAQSHLGVVVCPKDRAAVTLRILRALLA